MRTDDLVAGLLTECADPTAITGSDPCRVRVYEKAARSVAGVPEDLAGPGERVCAGHNTGAFLRATR